MISVLRETHETPREVQEALNKFGLNRFGEPKYRAIWGWNSMYWIGGEFTEYDRSGNYLRTIGALRYVPRYAILEPNRWYFEKWCPPEMYGSPEKWNKTVETVNGVVYPQLGPYPSRGEYETSESLDKDGEFVQITPSLAREWAVRNRAKERYTEQQIENAVYQKALKDEKASDNFRHDAFGIPNGGRNEDFAAWLAKQN